MDNLITIFSTVCLLLSMLSAFILLFVNKERVFSNNLLGILLLILSSVSFLMITIHGGYLIEIPNMYRVVVPLTFMLCPICYLYMRSVLNWEKLPGQSDWIVFVGAIFCAINFIPVYMMPYEQKLELVKKYIHNRSLQGKFDDGLLPAYIFSFIRTIWSGVFIYLQYRLIKQFRKGMDADIVEINEEVLQWLRLLSNLFLGLLVVFCFATLLAPFINIGLIPQDITFCCLVMIITIKLFTTPRLLYGVIIPSGKSTNVEKLMDLKIPAFTIQGEIFSESIQRNKEYKDKIDAYFEKEKPFLNVDYDLEKLVVDVQIPRHQLSSFINQEYGIGFRKYLNKKRIDYMIANSKKEAWQHFTLEAIAFECGFANRSTFIKNFKEVTGKIPMEYFREKVEKRS